MYSRNSFGNYYPIYSMIHKLNPVVKILNFIIFLVLTFITNSFELTIIMLVLVLFMVLLSKVPYRFYFNMLYSLRYILIALVIGLAFSGFTLKETIVYVLKVIMVVEYLSTMIYTTSPSELNYGIEKLLSPFNLFGINISGLIMFFTSSIRFIPVMIQTEHRILKSQASRGIDYNHSGIFGRIYAVLKAWKNTLRLSFKTMRETKESMKIRMFSTKKFRTNIRTNRFGFNDLILLLFHLFLIAVYLRLRGVI